MFTGITEQVGKIESLDHSESGGRLRVSFQGTAAPGGAAEDDSPIAASTKLGDSISVNGCCLTVVEFDAHSFTADLSGETLRRTNFGEKKRGHLVNLERPLAAGARLGGHFMQGHVDGVGRTVARWHEGIADIAIIPFTYARTNVRSMSVNDAINIETDILAKYVESLLHNEKSQPTSHLTVKHLVEEGF